MEGAQKEDRGHEPVFRTSKSLRIVEERGRFYLDFVDGAGSFRLAEFRTSMAVGMFCDLARKPGIVLSEESNGR